MNLGDSLVCYSYLRKIWILEEPVIRLFFLDAQSHSPIDICIVSARFGKRNLSSTEHLNVTTILILYSAFTIFGAGNIFDFDAGALIFLSLDREVDIDAKLAVFDFSIRDTKAFEELLKLTNDKLGIVRMSGLSSSHDLQQRHSSSIVVDQYLIVLVDTFCCVLLHLDAFDQNVVLILLKVIEEETAIEHDRIVLLRDLVSLRQVSIHVVFPVELDLRQDAPSESERSLDREIEALLVENGEHTWKTKIDEVGVSIGFLACGV